MNNIFLLLSKTMSQYNQLKGQSISARDRNQSVSEQA